MGCLLFWMATTTLKFGSCFRVGLLILFCGFDGDTEFDAGIPLALRRSTPEPPKG